MAGFSLTEFILGQLSGFAFGLIASFVSWWILVHLVVPRVGFSPIISKIPYDTSAKTYAYRVKIKNIGSRDLVDGYVIATIAAKGLRFAKTWTTFRIPLSFSGETTAPMPVLKRGKNKIFRLCFDLCPDFKMSAYLPETMREDAKHGRLTFEQILSLDNAYLRIIVVGADAISGARKVFESSPYRLRDIYDGTFKAMEGGAPLPPVFAEPAAAVPAS